MDLPLRIGLKECDVFFKPHRDRTVCRGRTREDFMVLPVDAMAPYEARYLAKYGDTIDRRSRLYDLYYGSVTNFKPSEAVRMFTLANTRCCLDPCAGWGGRAMGAILYGCKYIGFDTNMDLQGSYIAMQEVYGGDVEVHCEDSSKADFSMYTYDTILTSPPYYTRELYPHMPAYESRKDWNETFLIPMIRNAWRHLRPGGHCFLNVPGTIYPILVEAIGRPADNQHEYRKQRRTTTPYVEQIYHWTKPVY